MERIPVSSPLIGDIEIRYVMEALTSAEISGSFGRFIPEFENQFSRFCGCDYGIATNNGTTALHLAMATMDIHAGDEILIPAYTNMATFFAAIYQGAHPIPIDSDPETWNMDPRLLESRITEKTKAIVVVHIFGHPAEMDQILSLADKYNLPVIEDCAQAHGALYKGRPVGSFGVLGCYSFYANKIITTGEGGMVVTNNPDLASRAKSLRNLAYGTTNRFMHLEVGYNYRMSNLQAALGCAQLERIEPLIQRKREIAARYASHLKNQNYLQLPIERPEVKNVYWMYHVVMKETCVMSRSVLTKRLADKGIETRPGFIPFNAQEAFIAQGMTKAEDCPNALCLGERSFYLPTGVTLMDAEIDYVAEQVLEILSTHGE